MIKLAALPVHSLIGFHVRLPPGSQHSDLESEKKKVCHCYRCRKHNSMAFFFLVRLQKHYSCPATLASISPCTGTASNDSALALAGARQVLPALHDVYSVLQSCFHAASHEKVGSQAALTSHCGARGRHTGGALQGQQVSLEIPHNPSPGIPNPVRVNLLSIFHSA